MARVPAFYSKLEADKKDKDAYHVCSNCPSGQNIHDENKEYGTGGLEFCDICDDLTSKDKC